MMMMMMTTTITIMVYSTSYIRCSLRSVLLMLTTTKTTRQWHTAMNEATTKSKISRGYSVFKKSSAPEIYLAVWKDQPIHRSCYSLNSFRDWSNSSEQARMIVSTTRIEHVIYVLLGAIWRLFTGGWRREDDGRANGENDVKERRDGRQVFVSWNIYLFTNY